MLHLWLIAFAAGRVAMWLAGPALGAAVVLAGLATRGRHPALAALAGVLVGLAPPAEPPPLGVSGVLDGVVASVAMRPDGSASMRMADARFDGEALPDPLTVRFEILDAPPPLDAPVRLEAVLERSRAYHNPSPFPPTEGPLHATGMSTPELAPERGVPWTAAVAGFLRRNLTFEDPTVTALHRALVLGDRTELPPELRWAYQDTGLAHLLAISGFNLAVLGWGLYKLARWVLLRIPRLAQGGRPTAIAAGAALLFVGAYTAVILPSDATDRAMLGMGIALGAVILGRRARGWRTISVCFLAALAVEPAALMRPGFQLTFAATAALIAVAPSVRAWKSWLEEPGRVATAWLRAALIVVGAVVIADLATFFATAPLGLCWFGQLTPHGLWLNLLAIPAMSLVVFPLALVTALTGLDLGASLAGRVFDDLVMAASHAVGSTSTEMWPVPLGMLACAGVLLALAPGRLRAFGAAAVALAAIGASLLSLRGDDLALTMLDVGHGDAIALRLPDGLRVLVDGGGARYGDEGSRLLAERVVVPALRRIGFAQIDLLVVTHADLDHAGAAAWIAARIPIGEVWVPPCARGAPIIEAIVRRVEAWGGQVRTVARQAPVAIGGAELEVLSPAADAVDPDGACRLDENDGSLVLRVSRAGRSVLLTGDIEARAEAELVARYGSRLRSDVLKAPHHGSRTSSTEAFLDAVRPSVVLVSGETGKPPWPPHRVVLERYRARGLDVRITSSVGAIGVSFSSDGRLALVEAFRPP